MIFKAFHPALIGACIVSAAGIWGCTNTRPPNDMLAATESEIAKARDLGAQEHAPVELLDAENKLDRAKTAINEEEYEEAEKFLEQAMVDAEYASIKSRSSRAKSAASTVNEDIEVLREELEEQADETGEYSGEPAGEGKYY